MAPMTSPSGRSQLIGPRKVCSTATTGKPAKATARVSSGTRVSVWRPTVARFAESRPTGVAAVAVSRGASKAATSPKTSPAAEPKISPNASMLMRVPSITAGFVNGRPSYSPRSSIVAQGVPTPITLPPSRTRPNRAAKARPGARATPSWRPDSRRRTRVGSMTPPPNASITAYTAPKARPAVGPIRRPSSSPWPGPDEKMADAEASRPTSQSDRVTQRAQASTAVSTRVERRSDSPSCHQARSCWSRSSRTRCWAR
ncbi:hypothetical protein ABH925_005617 [Streptacidiphilus sp. EB129]